MTEPMLEREARGAATTSGAPGRSARQEARRDDAPTLLQAIWIVWDARWTVIATAVVALGLGAAYLFVTPPEYRASVLIQVENQTRSIAGFADTVAVDETRADAEIEILRSRPLLGAVVDELGLDVAAHPRTMPIVGEPIARQHVSGGVAEPPFGPPRYAWGGERIRVDRLDAPPGLLGQELVLTAGEGGHYKLADAGGAPILEGEVGTPATGRGVELLVSELVARPGTELVVKKRPRADVVDQLGRTLLVEEKGRGTGIVSMTLDGTDPARAAAVLDAIAAWYVKQNVERTSAEAAKALAFVESQLPILKKNVSDAEASLNTFQRHRGIVNLGTETQTLLARSAELEREIAAAELSRSELDQRYGARHPDVAAIAARAEGLRAQQAAIAARLRTLPDAELESARLTRNVDVATSIYLLLLNKAQELRILKSGTIGNVRVLENATVPTHPDRPRRGQILGLALLLGLCGGAALGFTRRQLAEGADDPEDVEAGTGLAVLATIPHSSAQRRLSGGARGARLAPLSVADPDDVAVEDLRALRTTVQFALQGARNNVVSVGGIAPRVGKSFVSVNLAHLLAGAGRRVLVVDGDLRRGVMNRYFGAERQPGLAEVVGGTVPLAEAIRVTDTARLDFLPTGALPPNPAELLASRAFGDLLLEASRRYDVVIVDTPPILSVTDGALVGRHAGVNLLVLRAGLHPVREVAFAMKRLARSGAAYYGAVLNDLHASRGRYGRYGRYRRYDG